MNSHKMHAAKERFQAIADEDLLQLWPQSQTFTDTQTQLLWQSFCRGAEWADDRALEELRMHAVEIAVARDKVEQLTQERDELLRAVENLRQAMANS